MNEFKFNVEGEPRPWASDERPWRIQIFRACRAHAARIGLAVPLDAPSYEISIEFRLSDSFDRADLDNLAKPVLDTLFLAANSQIGDHEMEAALSNHDDARVVHLKLHKIRHLNVGVVVTVNW